MEDWMERVKGMREFEAAGVRGDLLEDPKWANPLVVEFLHRTFGGDVPSIEPRKVVDLEGVRDGIATVHGGFGVLFQRRGELFAKVGVKRAEVGGHRGGLGRRSVLKMYVEGGMVPFIGEEGGCSCGRVRCVVVGELGEGEERDPIVLLVVDIDPEILLEDLIDAFGLTVRLGVVRGREVGLDAEEVAERAPELGGEEFASVRDYVSGEAMLSEDFPEEDERKLGSIERLQCWDEAGHFRQPVNHYENAVEALGNTAGGS